MMGHLSYGEWCFGMERRYDVLPPWYFDTTKREAAYATYKNTATGAPASASADTPSSDS